MKKYIPWAIRLFTLSGFCLLPNLSFLSPPSPRLPVIPLSAKPSQCFSHETISIINFCYCSVCCAFLLPFVALKATLRNHNRLMLQTSPHSLTSSSQEFELTSFPLKSLGEEGERKPIHQHMCHMCHVVSALLSPKQSKRESYK